MPEPRQESEPKREDTIEVHRGHRLEEGVLARAREWTDVLPGLRLVRVLRLAGSPLALGVVTVAALVWLAGLRSVGVTPADNWCLPSGASWLNIASSRQAFDLLAKVASMSTPFHVIGAPTQTWLWLAACAWTILVWTVPVMYLLRQGARLTAGRDLQDTPDVLRFACRRFIPAIIAIVMPALCTLPFFVVVAIAGWINSLMGSWPVANVGLGVLAAFTLLPAAILGFGSFVAVPLSLTAIMTEREPDALDALSRGYEVFFRRPLHLMGHAACAWLIALAIVTLVTGMATFAIQLAAAWMPGGSIATPFEAPSNAVAIHENGTVDMNRTVIAFFEFVPQCVSFALSCGLIGGVYLLTRKATGGQEIEDIDDSIEKRPPPLPELPQQTDT